MFDNMSAGEFTEIGYGAVVKPSSAEGTIALGYSLANENTGIGYRALGKAIKCNGN